MQMNLALAKIRLTILYEKALVKTPSTSAENLKILYFCAIKKTSSQTLHNQILYNILHHISFYKRPYRKPFKNEAYI